MVNFYCNPVNYDILNLAIHLTDGLGFIQGAGVHVSPADKTNNVAATIQAILSINHPEITLARVHAVLSQKAPVCISKEIQIIRNFIDAYHLTCNFAMKTENPLEDFMRLNNVLTIEITAFDKVHRHHRADSEQSALKPIFKDIVLNEYIPPYLRAAAVFRHHSDSKIFAEFNAETFIFLSLYILFQEAPLIAELPLAEMVRAMIKSRTAPFDDFLMEMLKALDDSSYPIAERILADRNAAKPDSATQLVLRLLSAMTHGNPMSSRDLMKRMGYRNLHTFRRNYLSPAVKSGLVEQTLPDRPSSSMQRYILSAKGRKLIKI